MSDIGFAGVAAFVGGWAMVLVGGGALLVIGVPAWRRGGLESAAVLVGPAACVALGLALLAISQSGSIELQRIADRWAPALAGAVLAGWAVFEWWRRS